MTFSFSLTVEQDAIELHTMEVETDNRDLRLRLESAYQQQKRHEETAAQLQVYAADIEALQQELDTERRKNLELHRRLGPLASSSPACKGLEPSLSMDSVAAQTELSKQQHISGRPAAPLDPESWAMVVERWQKLNEELQVDMDNLRSDQQREKQFFKQESARLRQEVQERDEELLRLKQTHETEIELYRIRLDEMREVCHGDI